LFGGGGDGNVIALHFDLRNAVHFHGHALARINFRRLHINRQQFERERVHFFKNRPDECAAALDHTEADFARGAIGFNYLAFDAGNDEHLVRADLGVTAEHHVEQQEQDNDDDNRGDDDNAAGHEVQVGQQGGKVQLHNEVMRVL
jgi:hypothetical protein